MVVEMHRPKMNSNRNKEIRSFKKIERRVNVFPQIVLSMRFFSLKVASFGTEVKNVSRKNQVFSF
jgi:hypothetical protein